jgi:hypothetical protein
MKRNVFAITIVLALALCAVQQAQASSFMSINTGVSTITCDNSTASGVTTCLGNGFSTSLNSNAITFTGTRDGVSFGGGGITGVQLTGNSPGTAPLAFTLDTKTSLVNSSGVTRTITIQTAQNNFTAPVGIGFLTASQTANWTVSGAGDSQAFTAWQRNDNTLTVPGPGLSGSTAVSPNCVSPGGLAQSCSSETPNVAANPTAPYSLTGQEIITMSNGSTASYTATNTLTATVVSTVPEPTSVVLLGTGLLFLAGRQWRKRKN